MSGIKMDCAVFDIDGTLADGSHREHYLKQEKKDWENYFLGMPLDSLHAPVADTCIALANFGFAIIYCTARPEKYRTITEDWINRFHLPIDGIFFRENGDFTDDQILKVQMMKKIEEEYNIHMIFEDRSRVVEALRSAGYKVFQVAKGDF